MSFCCFGRCLPEEKEKYSETRLMDVAISQPRNKQQFQDKENLLEQECINMKQLSSNGESPPAMVTLHQTAVAQEAHPPSHPVLLQDLAEYVQNAIQTAALRKEHELIKKGQLHSWNRAENVSVKEKNRYGKLLAYDKTRVVLDATDDDNATSDYINANYIDGYRKPKAYIATQGPKENTCADFWRMVWQEKSSKIIMLTNIVEVGKKKCEKYWPDAVHMYDSITVTLEKTEVSADYTIRTFRLKKANSAQVHHVQQFHYTSWPDHGVPIYPSVLVSFIKKVKNVPSPADSGPIIVHCSAGIGRTGTVMLVDSMMDMGNEEKKVDVLQFLYNMRQQRINILDNPDQYEFVHTALVEALLIDSTAIASSKFPDFYCQIKCQNEPIKKELQQQYKILDTYRPVHQSTHTRAGLDPQNAAKNRNSRILPDEKQRVYLKQTSLNQSDYINAIYVSGYKQKDSFIVTQYPMSHTVNDYWRLVVEKNCPLIVILNALDTTDQTSPTFWPLEAKTESFGTIQVTTTTVESDNGILVYNLTIKGSTKGLEQPMPVTLIHYPFWNHQQDIPQVAEKFVQLLDLTFRYRQMHQMGQVLVTCYDGSSSCGLFCALAFICEKVKVEQEVDVFTAVRSIRTNRPSFIKNMAQYLFCYEATMSFLESFALYANFQ